MPYSLLTLTSKQQPYVAGFPSSEKLIYLPVEMGGDGDESRLKCCELFCQVYFRDELEISISHILGGNVNPFFSFQDADRFYELL